MESSSQDRNLPASPRKLQRARDDGQVARSQDLGHLAVLGGGAITLFVLAPYLYSELRLAMGRQLTFDATVVQQSATMLDRLEIMVLTGLVGCVLFAVVVSAVAVLGTIAAGGWVFSLKPVIPDLSRLNPLQGLQGMFTKKKLAEIVKLSFIAVFILLLAIAFIHATLPSVASLLMQPSVAGLARMFEWLMAGCGLLLAVILIVALVDVPLQGYLHRSQLKMSLKEVRREAQGNRRRPADEGSYRRQRQRELAQRNSIAAVPAPTLVVMNPTHYAVADPVRRNATMGAPRVISKGADLIAMKIRDVAKSTRCPCCSRPCWRAPCTPTPRSTATFPSACTPPWRRCWPMCTSSRPRWQGAVPCPVRCRCPRCRRARSALEQQRPPSTTPHERAIPNLQQWSGAMPPGRWPGRPAAGHHHPVHDGAAAGPWVLDTFSPSTSPSRWW
jgi:flagellar biosynthesis protein FlhB